jgi:hypothetical protein
MTSRQPSNPQGGLHRRRTLNSAIGGPLWNHNWPWRLVNKSGRTTPRPPGSTALDADTGDSLTVNALSEARRWPVPWPR